MQVQYRVRVRKVAEALVGIVSVYHDTTDICSLVDVAFKGVS